VDNVKLKKGTHTLSAVADVKNSVTESEENNNMSISVRCKDE
jgi:subtilase family serine protease